MRYEFKSWAEYKDFMSEHWKELEEDDEIAVAEPLLEGSDAAETKLRVVVNYEKKKEAKRKEDGGVTLEWLTLKEGE